MIIEYLKTTDIKNEEGKLDIYSFMRSDVIRDYMRANKVFSPLEKAKIIALSFNPIETKIAALKMLAEESDGNDKGVIESAYRLLDFAMKVIKAPEDKVIYSVSTNALPNYLIDAMDENNCSSPDHYYSYDDFVKDYNWVIEDQDTEDNNYIDCYHVDIIPFENKGYEYPEIISFKAAFFENEMRIFYISVDKGWARMNGFTETDVEIIDGYYDDSTINRYSLPFINGENVMIKTPFMRRPLCGKLSCNMDAFGCWYYFFYYDDIVAEKKYGSLDLSYHELEFGLGLSVFDWLLPSDIEPSENVKKQIEMYMHGEISSISDIKEEGYAKIICKVKKVSFGENRDVNVTLEDESGTIDGLLQLYPGDKNWILELSRNNGKLELAGHFIRRDNGTMFMDFSCDTYVLSRSEKYYI